jgi:hypothetical protein
MTQRAVALLEVGEDKRDSLAAAQPASDQQSQDGAIPLAFQGGRIRAVDESPGLHLGQSVPCPDALLLIAGDLVDAGGGFGIQPAVQCHLARQLFHGRQALVDRRGSVAFGLKYGAVSLDGGAGEARSSLLCAPGEEVVESLGVHSAGGGPRDGVEDRALDGLERDHGGISV